MLNKVILIGRLGKDPEFKSTATMDICKFSLATSESYKKNGEWVEKAEWHNITIFGKLSAVGKRISKGSLIYLEGKISTNKWKDTDGNEKSSKDIIANMVRVIDSKNVEGEKVTHRPESPVVDIDEDDNLPDFLR